MSEEILIQAEIILGSIGIILGLFFGIFLLQSRKNQPRANFFLAIYLLTFSLRIGKSVFHNFFEIDSTVRTFFLATLLCVGPSLWLYTKNLMLPKVNQQRQEIIHYLPFFVLLFTFWLIPNDGTSFVFAIFYNGLTLHMFGYALFSFIWYLKRRGEPTTEEKAKTQSWLRSFLVFNLILIIVYFLISEVLADLYIGLSFLFSAMIFFFSVSALKNPFLFRIPREKYFNSSMTDSEATQLVERLQRLMQEEKPFLDPKLTQTKLCERMGTSVKELSQAINQVASANYSEFVAKYRVNEAKELLGSDSHSNFTIAAIAYECGFNSISSFNSQFKKYSGTTAIEYQKSLRK